MGQVPLLIEEDSNTDKFVLSESTSIMRYLSLTHPVADHWYATQTPATIEGTRVRAMIDSRLDWYHAALRPAAKDWVFWRCLAPRVGAKADAELAAKGAKGTARCMKVMEGWLASSSGRFIAGTEKLSLADLSAACEISQLEVLPINEWSYETMAKDFPRVADWHARVRGELGPHWDEAHTIVKKAVASFRKEQQGQGQQLQ